MADVKAVQLQLEYVINFLRPLLPLANCHMVNFLNGHFWEKYISAEMRNEYGNIGLTGVHKIFWSLTNKESNKVDPESNTFDMSKANPFIYDHFSAARKTCLMESPDICLSNIQFQNKIKSWNCDYFKEFSVSGFMSAKKTHEVETMSYVVAAISNITCSTHIIDVGSGRGYLSSILALLHGQRVLGIDSSHINTHSAAKRSEKLQKYWPGMCKRTDESCSSIIPKKRGKHWKSKVLNKTGTGSSNCVAEQDNTLTNKLNTLSSNDFLYRQTTMYISEDSNLQNIVGEIFPEDSLFSNLSLVGLHTCGNLAATCLKLFANNNDIKALCNVGCCYHLIEEEFSVNPFHSAVDDEKTEFGFPMSQFLLSQKFSLGRNARMLAAQAIDRLSEKKEVSVNSLFFRALLQVILEKKVGEDRSDWQVGRIATKCTDFKEYCYKSLEILKLDIQLTEEEISCFYNQYIEKKNELEAFFLFRIALAPVIETVILLDRLLYLLEKNFKEAHIVHLFDPVISPRCYALVAVRDLECALNKK